MAALPVYLIGLDLAPELWTWVKLLKLGACMVTCPQNTIIEALLVAPTGSPLRRSCSSTLYHQGRYVASIHAQGDRDRGDRGTFALVGLADCQGSSCRSHEGHYPIHSAHPEIPNIPKRGGSVCCNKLWRPVFQKLWKTYRT